MARRNIGMDTYMAEVVAQCCRQAVDHRGWQRRTVTDRHQLLGCFEIHGGGVLFLGEDRPVGCRRLLGTFGRRFHGPRFNWCCFGGDAGVEGQVYTAGIGRALRIDGGKLRQDSVFVGVCLLFRWIGRTRDILV